MVNGARPAGARARVRAKAPAADNNIMLRDATAQRLSRPAAHRSRYKCACSASNISGDIPADVATSKKLTQCERQLRAVIMMSRLVCGDCAISRQLVLGGVPQRMDAVRSAASHQRGSSAPPASLGACAIADGQNWSLLFLFLHQRL